MDPTSRDDPRLVDAVRSHTDLLLGTARALDDATAPSLCVKPPRVARSPAALECRLWKTLETPGSYTLVFGEVVAVYIDDRFITTEGLVDTGAMRVLSRLGYMDYGVLSPESVFSLQRPLASADGQTAVTPTAQWDGVYR